MSQKKIGIIAHVGHGKTALASALVTLLAHGRHFKPSNCPHCEYDRRFPDFESGGWMQRDNNGPIVPCPVCNPDGAQPRS